MNDSQSAPSKLVRTASLVSSFGVVSVVVGILGVQLGILPPMVAFGLFALGTLLCGSVGLVLGAAGLFATRNDAAPGDRGTAWRSLAVSLVLVVVVMIGMSGGSGLPRINDITTDVDDPPQFAQDLYGDRDMSYPPTFGVFVEESYPDLDSITTDLDAETAYQRAVNSARSLGWEITGERIDEGSFDAIERTALFRFVDDVTVRVRDTGDQVVVDVRSKSRDGQGDLGANAARIRRFVAEYQK